MLKKTSSKGVEEDIIKRMETIIDARVDAKVKNLQNLPENPNFDIDAAIDKRIGEKLSDENDTIHATLNKKVSESVAYVNNQNPDFNLDAAIDKRLGEKLSDENDTIHTTLNKKVSESVASVSNQNLPVTDMEIDGDRRNKIKVPPTFATAVKQVSQEMNEIQRRKLQIVISNLQETGSVEADKRIVQEVFEILDVYPEITNVMRLGKPAHNKQRLLRVSLENMADKRTVLSRATRLRNVPNDHKFAYVYVKPNLTPQQQETSKNLHLQLKAVRLKHPNTNYKISRGQIVIVPTPQA